MLTSPTVEVGLYPSDISISGVKRDVARARAAIASRLTSTAAHLTTSREAQAVEDRLERIARKQPEVDGDGAPVLPADYLMQGVPVGPGHHIINLAYRDTAVINGLKASAAAWGALLLAFLAALLIEPRTKRRSQGAASAPAPMPTLAGEAPPR